MGMYTELVLGVRLKEKLPVLEYMLRLTEEKPDLPNHALFQTERWNFMLRSDSYYFQGSTQHLYQYDDIAKQYEFNVRCNLKNYGDEIKMFLDWIGPYVEPDDGCAGYFRYEEDDDPTLIYFLPDRITLKKTGPVILHAMRRT